jgi:hypothetical protein
MISFQNEEKKKRLMPVSSQPFENVTKEKRLGTTLTNQK